MITSSEPLEGYAVSHQGMVRQSNQDAYWFDNRQGIYALADGVGGLPGGSQASRRAVNLIQARSGALASGQIGLRECLLAGHQAVVRLGKRLSPDLGIGTTLSLARIRGDLLELVHVGDCIVGLWRSGCFTRVSVDHVSAPVKIRNVEVRGGGRLEQYLGQDTVLRPQVLQMVLEAGDWIVLASDGLTKTVDDDEIGAIIGAQKNARKVCEGLVAMSNLRGGTDNTTVVAVHYRGSGETGGLREA